MRVNFHTLGCRLNEAETESWAAGFRDSGDTVVKTAEQADLIVLNTCAVTGEAARKSRQMIRRLHRGNPNARLVVSGCESTLNPEQTARMLGVDLVVPNRDKDRLVTLTRAQLFPHSRDSVREHTAGNGETLLARGRQRAFIKVQDGCRHRCTFCIVTRARGDERSRPAAEIVQQVRNLHRDGINEVILSGVHLGGYGSDLGSNLAELLEQVLEHTEIPRVRLGSLEPWDLPQNFFRLFQNPRLMPHLHLPLQSGSDTVLKRMARRCRSAEFRQLNEQARRLIADINITTDIIVGFPGESEREWSESLQTIQSLDFGHIHIFCYSQREGTHAATLADQVPEAVKKHRSRQLHELAADMKNRTYQRFSGRQFEVLWEGAGTGRTTQPALNYGYTPNFLRLAVTATDQDLENRILAATLVHYQPGAGHALARLEE